MPAAGSCTAHAWAKVPAALTPDQRREWKARAAALLKRHGAVLVAHYYVDGDLRDLALETGGIVADSLEMARFGRDHAAKTLVVAGVRFMGESAKILSPTKRVLMPDLDATCSLDLGCPPDQFAAFCDAHPDRTVVVYANTSAAVKARRLDGDELLCAGDRRAPEGARREDPVGAGSPPRPLHPGADRRRHAVLERRVHRARRVQGLELDLLRREHPGAKVLVHPESPPKRDRAGRHGGLDRRRSSTRC